MKKLLKQLNRYNGNLCFVGETDSSSIVFECDRINRSISQQVSSKYITGLCNLKLNSYLVCYGDNYLGLFENGILNDIYIDTGLAYISKIASRRDGVVYALDNNISTVYRISIDPFNIDWSLNVNDLNGDGDILVKESDNCIVIYDNESIFYVGDMETSGIVINNENINNEFTVSYGEFNASHSFMRWRQVYGDVLDRSSSSSSSSSS